jgi:PAS domain S-box-containing protein
MFESALKGDFMNEQSVNPMDEFYEQLQETVIHQASRIINNDLYTKSLLSTLPVSLISTDRDGKIQVVNNAAEEILNINSRTAKGTALQDFLSYSPEIMELVNRSLSGQAAQSMNSLPLRLDDGQEKVVNVHVQPFYDEEDNLVGILFALEDQTYISFLRESFKQHTPTPSDGEFICLSPKMKKLAKQFDEFTENNNPVLFSGPCGAGKSFLAAKLHKARDDNGQAPFIMLDCQDLDQDKARETIFGATDQLQDSSQSIRFKSLHDYGTVHLAEGGSLVLLNIDKLAREPLEALYDFLMAVEKEKSANPRFRLLATTEKDPADFLDDDDFFQPLARLFLSSNLKVIPLCQRRKDILPLARIFLKAKEEGKEKKLSKGAENALLSKQYTQNNVKELKDAIELAVLVADGDTLYSEHIFTGPLEEESAYEVDLTDFSLVQWLINDTTLMVLRGFVLSFFAGLIGVGLFFPDTIAGLVGNHLVWGVWWPSLVFAFLILGRVWCTVCPLSTAGRLAGKIIKMAKAPPLILKNNSVALIPVGFVFIVWVEHVFHMTTRPTATAYLLIGLILSAIFFSVLFKRETWCRYLCPLGNFGGLFSLSSTIFVRSNSNVCSTKCTTHNCNKGSEKYDGCPVFHHPLYSRNSHICKLCFNCIKSCPNGSARLYLRPPLLRIWKQQDIAQTIGYFALVLFFLTPVLLSSERIDFISNSSVFTVMAIAALICAFISRHSLLKLFFAHDEQKILRTTRLSLIFLLLAWGPFAAFQMQHLPGVAELYIAASQENGMMSRIIPTNGISLLNILQLGCIGFGVLLGMVSLIGTGMPDQQGNIKIAGRKGYFLFFCICLLYLLLNSWVVLS